MNLARRWEAAVLVGLMLAGAASAEAQAPNSGADDMRRSGLPEAPAWWSASGRAGWTPDADFGSLYPWAYAGHARGGWSLRTAGGAGESQPWPGLLAGRTTLASLDSLAVGPGGGAAWSGFEAAMVPVRATPLSPDAAHTGAGHALGMFSWVRGSSAIQDNALTVVRDDSLMRLGIDVSTRARGAVGAYGDMGVHRYGGTLGLQRGSHHLEGAFTQRGSAMSIADQAAEQSASGAAGRAAYSYTHRADAFRVELARATLYHESFGWLIDGSRRDQSDQSLDLSWQRGEERRGTGAHLSLWQGQVRRRILDRDTADTKASGVWLAARSARPLGELQLAGSLGLGSQTGSGGVVVVPSLVATTMRGGWTLHALAERVAIPLWSDLAPGQAAFLQDTWTANAGIARQQSHTTFSMDGRVGTTSHRAVVPRLPLEELWLRSGWRADPESYRFVMGSAMAGWRRDQLAASAEGFLLGRDRSTLQPNVDPAAGIRLELQGGRRFFRNDLDVRLRVRGSALSTRESEGNAAHSLAPYATFDASVVVMLSDVIVVFDMVGLEDRPHPLTWIDPRTGVEALGAGFESRIAFSWRLFD